VGIIMEYSLGWFRMIHASNREDQVLVE